MLLKCVKLEITDKELFITSFVNIKSILAFSIVEMSSIIEVIVSTSDGARYVFDSVESYEDAEHIVMVLNFVCFGNMADKYIDWIEENDNIVSERLLNEILEEYYGIKR